MSWSVHGLILVIAMLSCTAPDNGTKARPTEEEPPIPGYLTEAQVRIAEQDSDSDFGAAAQFTFPGKGSFPGLGSPQVRLVKVSEAFFDGRGEEVTKIVRQRVSQDIVLISFFDGTKSNIITRDKLVRPYTFATEIADSAVSGQLKAFYISNPGMADERSHLADVETESDGSEGSLGSNGLALRTDESMTRWSISLSDTQLLIMLVALPLDFDSTAVSSEKSILLPKPVD